MFKEWVSIKLLNTNNQQVNIDFILAQYNQQQSWGQNISLSTPQPAQQQGFGNISLTTTTTSKK